MAAANAFMAFDPSAGLSAFEIAQSLYAERWGIYTGTAFSAVLANSPFVKPTLAYKGIYRNTRLVWKQGESVVDFYVAHVYAGDYATDGKPLPNGTLGALPIDPQVGNGEVEKDLRIAISETLTMWNWKAQMGLRPMYVAALGDSMTRLVDDVERGTVYPEIVWPGYVKEVELDHAFHVKRYVLEYQVTQKTGDKTETFRYREEVDKEAYRYFKGDRPWDRFETGNGGVDPNPYGFVPAIWDRFKVMPNSVRGASALDGTRQALYEVNSLLSHAIDHQRKLFIAPVLIQGAKAGPTARTEKLTPPEAAADDRRDNLAAQYAETFPIWPMGDRQAAIHQVTFDIADTEVILQGLKQGIYDESPEARFYPELRAMSQVTAPGAEMALGDAVARARRLRNNLDPGTIALIQMNIAMCGYRMSLPEGQGGWPRPFTQRQQAFAPFDLESFKAGKLDFGILDRPVIVPSESDRLDLLLQKQQLNIPDEAIWREMGVEDTEIKLWQQEALQRAEAARVAFSRGDVGIQPPQTGEA